MRKRSIAVLIAILVVCILLSASIGLNLTVFNKPTGNTPSDDINSTFTLTTETNETNTLQSSQTSIPTTEVIGHAYDRHHRKSLNVIISATGTIDGNIEKNLKIRVRGGDIKIGDNEPFSITDGSATLSKSGVVTLELTLAQQYGGQPIKWVLNCEVKQIGERTYTVLLTADSLMLPIDGYPTIEDLSITCIIRVH